MSRPPINNNHLLLLLVSATVLACYCIAGFFTHPSGDDFTYALLGQQDNFLETVLNERERWNGRYISNFIVIFSPLNWGGILAYQLMPTILISLLLLGSYGIYRNLIGKGSLVLSFVSTTILFSILPDITEGIYWYTGAWTYLPGAVLFLLGISLLIKHQDHLNFITLTAPILLFVVAAGFNEVIGLLGGVTFLGLLLSKKHRAVGIALTTLFALLMTYTLLAPGNSVREAYFTSNHDFFYASYMGIAYTARFIGEWILNPALYIWGVLLFTLDISPSHQGKLKFLRKPFISLLVLLLPTFIACFAPIWSTGMLGQYRTANLASFLFVISLSLILIANKNYLIKRLNITMHTPVLMTSLILCLLLWKNQYQLFTELFSGELSAYHEEMEDRYELIEACDDHCVLPAIQHQSETLFVYPLQEDEHHWINEAYAKYFNKKSIHLSE